MRRGEEKGGREKREEEGTVGEEEEKGRGKGAEREQSTETG